MKQQEIIFLINQKIDEVLSHILLFSTTYLLAHIEIQSQR